MKKLAFAVLCLSVLASCNHNKVTIADIDHRMDTINLKLTHGVLDTSYVAKTYNMLMQYQKAEPADTGLPRHMMRMAVVLEAHRMYNKSIETLDAIQTAYPQSQRAAKACLTEGFIYDNYLKQLDKAKAKYMEFLQKYPNTDPRMTDMVRTELQNLGKTPDQIFQEMQAKAKADSTTKASAQ